MTPNYICPWNTDTHNRYLSAAPLQLKPLIRGPKKCTTLVGAGICVCGFLFKAFQWRCPRMVVICRLAQDPLHLGVLQVAMLAASHRPDCSSQLRWTVPVQRDGQKHTLRSLKKKKKKKSKGAALFKAVNEVDAVKSCVRCSNIYKSKGALKLVICILGWVHFGVSTEWQNVVLTLQVYAAFSASFGFFVIFFALIIAPFTLWFSWKGSSTIKVWVLSKTSDMRECYK